MSSVLSDCKISSTFLFLSSRSIVCLVSRGTGGACWRKGEIEDNLNALPGVFIPKSGVLK